MSNLIASFFIGLSRPRASIIAAGTIPVADDLSGALLTATDG